MSFSISPTMKKKILRELSKRTFSSGGLNLGIFKHLQISLRKNKVFTTIYLSL